MTAFDPKPERQRVVLVVTHYYGAHGGGVERVADRLIREMTAFSNRYHFSWAASGTDPKPEGPSLSALPMRTFNLLERFTGLPWPVWGPASLRRLKRAVAAADIVWLHDTLYPGNLLAYRWARQKKARDRHAAHQSHSLPQPGFARVDAAGRQGFSTQNMLRDATQTLFHQRQRGRGLLRPRRVHQIGQGHSERASISGFSIPLTGKEALFALQGPR